MGLWGGRSREGGGGRRRRGGSKGDFVGGGEVFGLVEVVGIEALEVGGKGRVAGELVGNEGEDEEGGEEEEEGVAAGGEG